MKFPFFCLLKEFPRDHDQAFAGSRPATLLLALILLPLSYVLGAFAATVIPSVPASADGNWGHRASAQYFLHKRGDPR